MTSTKIAKRRRRRRRGPSPHLLAWRGFFLESLFGLALIAAIVIVAMRGSAVLIGLVLAVTAAIASISR